MKTQIALRFAGWLSCCFLILVWIFFIGKSDITILKNLFAVSGLITPLSAFVSAIVLFYWFYTFHIRLRNGLIKDKALSFAKKQREKWVGYTPCYFLFCAASNLGEEYVFRGALVFILAKFGIGWALISLPIQALLWGFTHFANRDQEIVRDIRRIKYYSFYLPIEGIGQGIIALLTNGIVLGSALHVFTNLFLFGYWMWFAKHKSRSRPSCAPE